MVHDKVRKHWPELAALIDTLNELDGRSVTVETTPVPMPQPSSSGDNMRARLFLYTGSLR